MINVTKTFLPPFDEYAAVLKRAWDKGWITNNGELVLGLQEKLKEYLPAPKVTVVVTGVDGSRASVVGKVLKPGPVLLNTPTTVLQAIAIAGALDRFADEDNIKVIRNAADGQQVFKVNYGDLVKGKSLESNIFLKAGDTVVVP